MIFGFLRKKRAPSDRLDAIVADTLEMGDDPFAPMSEILQLACRLSEVGGVAGVLGALDAGLLDHEAFRVRRVVFIAMRRLGPTGYACDPASFDRHTIAGLADPSPYVQLDAAWLAGLVATPDGAVHEALQAMVTRLGTPDDGSTEAKTLERAGKALAEIEARRSPP